MRSLARSRSAVQQTWSFLRKSLASKPVVPAAPSPSRRRDIRTRTDRRSAGSATNFADVIVKTIAVNCTKLVSSPDDKDGNPNDNHVTILADGNSHNVTYTITINNTGDADLIVHVSDVANAGSDPVAAACALP